jgi:hypothetical protein
MSMHAQARKHHCHAETAAKLQAIKCPSLCRKTFDGLNHAVRGSIARSKNKQILMEPITQASHVDLPQVISRSSQDTLL